MELRAGSRLRSVVCETEVIVVSAPSEPVDLRCGGEPMVAMDAARRDGTPNPSHGAGTKLGKRYADPGGGLEVLCTKAGAGSLSVGDSPLEVKAAKPLPSSD